MLQVLQYLTGTSIAAVSEVEVANLTETQSFIGGPIASGSAVGSAGGNGWRFRGMTLNCQYAPRQSSFDVLLQDRRATHAQKTRYR